MITLTLNNEQYRIRRLDPKNLVIERHRKAKEAGKVSEDWGIEGYYGRLEDLAPALLKLATHLPKKEVEDLAEIASLLRQETEQARLSIISELRRHGEAINTVIGQKKGNPETDKVGVR